MDTNKYAFGRDLVYKTNPLTADAIKTLHYTTPLMMRKQRDAMQAQSSALDAGLDFNYFEEDDPTVKPELEKMDAKIGELSKALVENPTNIGLSNELYRLNRDYKKLLSPDSAVGQAKAKYANAQKQWEEVKKSFPKDTSPGEIQRQKQVFFGERAKSTEDEFVQDFIPGRTSGIYDFQADIRDALGDATGKISQLVDGDMSKIEIDNSTGIPQFKVTSGTSGELASNVDAINAGLRAKMVDWMDPTGSTDRSRYAQISGMTPEYMQTVGNQLAMSMYEKDYEKTPTTRTTYKNIPESKDGLGEYAEGPSKGNRTTIISRNTAMRNNELFDTPEDVGKAALAEENTFSKSAANNLITNSVNNITIPNYFDDKDELSELSPADFYQKVSEEASRSGMYKNRKEYLEKSDNPILTEEQWNKTRKKWDVYKKLKETIDNNIKTNIDVRKGDLSTPVYSFNPSMPKYATSVNNFNKYLNNSIKLEDIDFVGGPLKDYDKKKLERKSEYENLKENRELIGIGAERDSGIFYIIKDDEGNEHMVTLKDPKTANNILVAHGFDRPELFDVHRYKDTRISGKKAFNIPGQGDVELNFKVEDVTTPEGYRAYKIEGKTNGDVYDPIINQKFLELKAQFPNAPEDLLLNKIIEIEGLQDIDMEAPYTTTSKQDIIKYNKLLNASKK